MNSNRIHGYMASNRQIVKWWLFYSSWIACMEHWLSEAVLWLKSKQLAHAQKSFGAAKAQCAANSKGILWWGQRRLASCNLALLLIVLMLSAFAKSSITAPNCQCRLLNSISSFTECMQTKNTATVLYPRRGGFEPRGNANAKSDNTNLVRLWSLESKTYTRTWNSHVNGWISWVKCHAMKCPWD